MASNRWFWLVCVLLLLVDFALHLSVLAAGPAPVCWDAQQYLEMGRLAAAGDVWLQNSGVNYRTPAYPWFLAVLFATFGANALFATVVCQHLLVWLANLVASWLAYRITQNRAIAAACYAVGAVCISRAWFANTLLTESLFALAATCLWLAWYEFLRAPTVLKLVAMTFSLALATLIRPIPQLLWIPMILTFVLTRQANSINPLRSQPMRFAIIIPVMTCLFGAPWIIRNWMLFDEIAFASVPAENKWQVCFQQGASANLPLPQCPATDQVLAALHSVDHDMNDLYCYSVLESLDRAGLDTAGINSLVDRMCWQAITENPAKFAWAMFKRTLNFWRVERNDYPPWGDGLPSEHGSQLTWRDERLAQFGELGLENALSQNRHVNLLIMLIVFIGSAGLITKRETRLFGLAVLLVFTYFALITAALEIENYRYRMVLEPLMIVCSVCGWSIALGRLWKTVTALRSSQVFILGDLRLHVPFPAVELDPGTGALGTGALGVADSTSDSLHTPA